MHSSWVRKRDDLRRELERLTATLGSTNVFDMDVEVVADMLASKAAIEHMLSVVAEEMRRHEEGERQQQRAREERERRDAEAAEALAREVEALRAAMASDPKLRAEVEWRNRIEALRGVGREAFDPLPGGFPDALRRHL